MNKKFLREREIEINCNNKKQKLIEYWLPDDIWKEIFYYLYFIESVRLCCKLFRNLSAYFWKQRIHIRYLNNYINNVNKFNFVIKKLIIFDNKINKIINKDFYFCIKNLPNMITHLKIHKIPIDKTIFKLLGNSITHLNIPKLKNSLSIYINLIPKTINEISFNTAYYRCAQFKNCKEFLNNYDKFQNKNILIGGESLLHLACEERDLNTIKKILLINKNNINILDQFKRSPIFVSCNEEDFETIQFFINENYISYGSDYDSKNNIYNLCYSLCNYGRCKTNSIDFLIKKNFDINKIIFGETLLNYNLRNSNFEIAKFLIQNGADINQINNKNLFLLHNIN